MLPLSTNKVEGFGFIVDMDEAMQEFEDTLSQFKYYNLISTRVSICEIVNAPAGPYDMHPVLSLVVEEAKANGIELSDIDPVLPELLYDSYADYLFSYIDKAIGSRFDRIQLSSWISKSSALISACTSRSRW